jgi:demethylmenaquinone methyltransferase/2-methoxy-6-polyprenyl-1,4-benzoquinol methylase
VDEPRRLIEEQIEYYRKRAAEYDETSAPPGDPLAAYARKIEAALDRFRPAGQVLEIASGTGTWTRRLLQHAATVTALDSSPEMHDLSREKLGKGARVRYIEADVFSWEPDAQYDVVFFSNWLSHVPPASFERFWALVRRALGPEGRVFLVDEVKDAWRNEDLLREDFVHGPSVPIVRRQLLDGQTFRVAKVFWDPEELASSLRDLGWDFVIHTSGPLLWGEGRRGHDVP